MLKCKKKKKKVFCDVITSVLYCNFIFPIHTGLWDSLLEARIKLQKVLSSTNQMPQHDTIEDFVESGGVELEEALSKGEKNILYIAYLLNSSSVLDL